MRNKGERRKEKNCISGTENGSGRDKENEKKIRKPVKRKGNEMERKDKKRRGKEDGELK